MHTLERALMKPDLVLTPFLLFTLMATSPTLAEVAVPIELDRPGKVSMGVYDGRGRLIRRIHVGDDMAAGKHKIVWDGLNEQGKAVEPGEYEWRLVNSPGLKSQFLTLLGTSKGYWHWPGGHEGPGSVEVVGDMAIMTANLVEGSSQWVAWDLKTGEVKWRQKPASGFGWISDISAGGEYIYASGFGRGEGELLIIQKNGKWLTSWSTWQRKILTWLPVREYELGGSVDNDAEQKNVELREFDQAVGHGWDSTDDIARVEVGGRTALASTKRRSATFRIQMPEGNPYRAAVVVGNPTDGPRSVEVKIHGPQRRTHTETLKLDPGEWKTVTSRRGQKHIRVTLSNPEGKDVGWALSNVRVDCIPVQIAAHEDELVLALRDKFLVWLDPMQGKQVSKRPFMVMHRPVETRRLKLEIDKELRDVEFLPDGRVVVLTENQLAEVLEDGKVRTLIDGLHHAAFVSADVKTGEVFIVEHGDSHQVKVFTSDLKLRDTFGRKGGRRQGRYEPHDFLEVADIAGDGRGGFVIVEGHAAPRRTAHFDRDGKLIREWYGAQTFFVHTWHDPKQPNHIWFDNGHGWATEAIVDFENGDWKPYATYKVAAGETGAAGKLDIRVQHTGYHGFHLRWHDGKRYLCKAGTPTVLRVDEEKRRVVPVAHAYRIAQNQYVLREDRVPTWATTWEEVKKHKYLTMMWSDLNSDGQAQREETRLSKGTFRGGDSWVAENLAYYTSGRDIVVPKWVGGIPVYPAPEEASKHKTEVNWRDAEGNFYYQYCRGHNDLHGFGWPSTMAAANVGLRKYAPDGETPLFDVGNKAVTWPGTHPEGQLHFPVKVAGIVKGTVGVAERVGMPVKFWTTDGLYVGHLFNRRGEGPEIAYHWWRVDPSKGDSFGPSGNQALFQYDTAAGGRLVERENGEVYFFGAGWNNVPTYRVTGLDDIRRQAGKITIRSKAPLPLAEGTGLAAEYFQGDKLSGKPVIERLEPQIHLGQFGKHARKQGNSRGWPKVLAGENKYTFSVRLSGQLEPKLSDTYTLLVYGGPADIYVDGEQILDASQAPPMKSGARYRSRPIRLTAGNKVPIRIEAERTAKQALYLCWEAEAITAEVIPAGCLYPE